MKTLRIICVLSFVAATVLVLLPNRAVAQAEGGAVFAMTNSSSNNQIEAFNRLEDG